MSNEKLNDKFSFNFINKALGLKPVDAEFDQKKYEEDKKNPMSPSYVSVDPITQNEWTGD